MCDLKKLIFKNAVPKRLCSAILNKIALIVYEIAISNVPLVGGMTGDGLEEGKELV
jgi:hypothetical protein